MSRTPALRALSAAHAIALKARVGTLQAPEIDRLTGYVAGHLDAEDPVRAMVDWFGRERLTMLRDRDAMARIGADLQRQVMRLMWPCADGRMDIHG